MTNARGHGNRGVRPGSSARALRRAYPRRVRIARRLYRANPHSPRLIGVRRGRVKLFAVATQRQLRHPGALSRLLQR
jgi:hypothetical protein